MIEVDISNIWCGLSLPDLLAIEKEVAGAHELLTSEQTQLPWMGLTDPQQEPLWNQIQEAARSIREKWEVCVITASADLCLGIQAALELLDGKEGPRILFAGDTLSTRRWNELNRQLEGKDFCLMAVSASGTTLESAIAFRSLRWQMERRHGTEEAARRIYAVTWEDTPLWQMAGEQHWNRFAIPQGVTASHSVLSAAGLLPMAVAGVDILELLQGVRKALRDYDLRSFENPLWLYVGARNALSRKGRRVERFGSTAPEARGLALWWQQLFAQSEHRGIYPAVAEYPRDIRCLDQRITEGGDIFETLIHFESEETPCVIGSDVHDLDGLNDLAGKTLEQVCLQAYRSVLAQHSDSGVPVIAMDCGQMDAQRLGQLFGFLELASSLSACISGNDFQEI